MSNPIPLGEALAVIIDHRGKTPRKLGGDFTAHGVPVVSAIHVKNGRIDWSQRERFVSESMFHKWMPVKLKKNDLLLTSEAPLGEVALVPDDRDLVLSQRLFALRGKPDVLHTPYLYYYFRTPQGQADLQSRASGSTVLGIRQSQLVKIELRLPPLIEQRRIAGVLGAFDDLIESDRALAFKQIDLGRSRWLQTAKKCEWSASFGELATLHREGFHGGAESPYLGLEHFSTDGGGLTGRGVLAQARSQQYVFSAGDILYGRLRPYFRKVARPGFSGACSGEIWVISPRDGIPPSFVEAIVSSPEFTEFADSGSEGTKMPRAKWDHVARFRVSMPPRQDMTRLDAVGETMWRASVSLGEEADQLRRTRDALLPQLMSGAIRVSEVEDSVP